MKFTIAFCAQFYYEISLGCGEKGWYESMTMLDIIKWEVVPNWQQKEYEMTQIPVWTKFMFTHPRYWSQTVKERVYGLITLIPVIGAFVYSYIVYN